MIESKLPDVGTTIFAVMSALANKHGAVNLAQGFPEFDPHPWLKDRLNYYVQSGANQYAPMPGTEPLRQAISWKIDHYYQQQRDPDTEITVTSGATEALFVAIQACIRPGDEAIVFDPAYDSYDPAIRLAGGRVHHIALSHNKFGIDWSALRQVFSKKTRLIIINSPHNPTGAILSNEDLNQLAELINGSNCLLLSDEVYEHIIFDNQPHATVLKHPGLKERAFTISSFGKTYHMTGWKIGYCVAPPALTKEFRKVHQFVTFSTSTPMQLALADMIKEKPDYGAELANFYQAKRDIFVQALKGSRFKIIPCHGTYFQLLDYSAISNKDDMDFCHYLTINHQIATIPVSPFCAEAGEQRLIRCCFAKSDKTLAEVGRQLAAL